MKVGENPTWLRRSEWRWGAEATAEPLARNSKEQFWRGGRTHKQQNMDDRAGGGREKVLEQDAVGSKEATGSRPQGGGREQGSDDPDGSKDAPVRT
jgi:hypothetical protein